MYVCVYDQLIDLRIIHDCDEMRKVPVLRTFGGVPRSWSGTELMYLLILGCLASCSSIVEVGESSFRFARYLRFRTRSLQRWHLQEHSSRSNVTL